MRPCCACPGARSRTRIASPPRPCASCTYAASPATFVQVLQNAMSSTADMRSQTIIGRVYGKRTSTPATKRCAPSFHSQRSCSWPMQCWRASWTRSTSALRSGAPHSRWREPQHPGHGHRAQPLLALGEERRPSIALCGGAVRPRDLLRQGANAEVCAKHGGGWSLPCLDGSSRLPAIDCETCP